MEIQGALALTPCGATGGLTTSTLVIGGGSGALGGGMGGLGGGGGASAPSQSGPTATAKVTIDRDLSQVSNVHSVVAGMTPGFRRCYARGLTVDPLMRGQVTLTATLGPNGEVMTAVPKNSTVSPSVTSCVVARISAAQFAPPTSQPSSLELTVRLEPAPPPGP